MQCYVDLDHENIYSNFSIFFCGCDFNCPYCFVPELLKFDEDKLVDIRDVKKQIQMSDDDKVILTGGEPCLQRQALLNISRFCKQIGKYVILDTNGSKPETIKSLLRGNLIDEVWLDVKAPKDKFEKVTKCSTFFISSDELFDKVKESVKLLKKFNVKYITVIVPSLIFKKEDVKEIRKLADVELKAFAARKHHVDKRFKDISSPSSKYLEAI